MFGATSVMTRRVVAALTGVILISGCAVPVQPARPTTAATVTGTSRTMRIVLEANVTGDGEATVAYEGDPTDPDGGMDTFRAHWTREFDIGYQDWAAIGKVHVTVNEHSGLNATVSCATLYDNTVGGNGKRTGPFKSAGCHIACGDVGDEEE